MVEYRYKPHWYLCEHLIRGCLFTISNTRVTRIADDRQNNFLTEKYPRWVLDRKEKNRSRTRNTDLKKELKRLALSRTVSASISFQYTLFGKLGLPPRRFNNLNASLVEKNLAELKNEALSSSIN